MSWRKYALAMGYNGPVAWKVRQGFTLKKSAPLSGMCHENLEYLQDGTFEDTPTSNAVVFWVPRLAERSVGMTISQMETRRVELRQSHNLPEHHGDRFGSIGLLFALILAHFKRSTELAPLNQQYAVSDTHGEDCAYLIAGGFKIFYTSEGLRCEVWLGDTVGGDPTREVGFYLLGVEELGQ